LLLVANGQSFINEDPEQPAAKFAFVFEARRSPRRLQPAVFDGIIGSFGAAKNTTCDEVQQLVAAPESRLKHSAVFVLPVCNQQFVRHRSPNIQSGGTRTLSRAYLDDQKNRTRSSLRNRLKWQRYGRGEHTVRIETTLQPPEPSAVAAVGIPNLFSIT
jgi:hypothetical protein